MRTLATCAAGLVLLVAGSAAAKAEQWYMGSPEAQRLFERNRIAFYEDAWSLKEFKDSTYSYGLSYSYAIGDMFRDGGLNSREGGASYGAIVYGYSDAGDAYGVTWNYEHLSLAHKDAFEICEDRGGEHCILRHVVRNGCIALARGYDQHGFGSGATESSARDAALLDCADALTCEIRVLECSTARHRQ